MTRIYVDLDGVLADFDHGAKHVLGMPCDEFQQLHGAALMWRRLADASDFYRKLPWTADGRDLWLALENDAPATLVILTGLPLGDWAEPQKRAWCLRELGPGIPVVCCMSIDKHRYCTPGDILIDDREKARLDWETAGGVFVHHIDAESTIAALVQIFLGLG